MAVPYTFGNATTSIPLSQLDTNFATAITIGNTAVYLGNTTTSFGNVTLTNVTISSGNATVTKITAPTLDAGSGNALTLQSNSTTGLYIDTSQNVGIGTSSPTNFGGGYKTLTVQGSSSSGGVFQSLSGGATDGRFYSIDASVQMGSWSNVPVLFYTNSLERMRIDSSGRVGISTIPAAGRGIFQLAPTSQSWFAMSDATAGYNYGTFYQANGSTVLGYIGAGGGNAMTSGAVTDLALRADSGNLLFATNGNNERMRIDSSGNVGIGTSSPAGILNTSKSNAAGYVGNYFDNTATNGYVRLDLRIGSSGGNGVATIKYAPGTFMQIGPDANDTTTPLVFATNNATERARIDSSGNLLVGSTSRGGTNSGYGQISSIIGSSSNNCFGGTHSGAGGVTVGLDLNYANTTGSAYQVYFRYNGIGVGSITSTTTATAYNTSSDYRLKENVQPMTTGLATITALKPVTYDWISDKSKGEGFIAHELQSVIPLAVTGEKDEVDENGNINPQGVDYSKIVVHLVAAIQELKAELDALKGTK